MQQLRFPGCSRKNQSQTTPKTSSRDKQKSWALRNGILLGVKSWQRRTQKVALTRTNVRIHPLWASLPVGAHSRFSRGPLCVPTCMVFPFARHVAAVSSWHPKSPSGWRRAHRRPSGFHRPEEGQEGEGRTRASFAGAPSAALLPGNVEAWPRGWLWECTRSCLGPVYWVVPYLLVLVLIFLPSLLPPPPNRHVVSEPLAPFNSWVLSSWRKNQILGREPFRGGHRLYLDGF